MLRDLPEPVETVSEEVVLLDPEGFSMSSPQRMTIKQARPWINRDEIPLGIWSCASAIEWSASGEKTTAQGWLRGCDQALSQAVPLSTGEVGGL